MRIYSHCLGLVVAQHIFIHFLCCSKHESGLISNMHQHSSTQTGFNWIHTSACSGQGRTRIHRPVGMSYGSFCNLALDIPCDTFSQALSSCKLPARQTLLSFFSHSIFYHISSYPTPLLLPPSSSYPLLAVFLCPLFPLLRLIYSHIIPHLHADTMQQLAMQKWWLNTVRHSVRIVELSVLLFLPSGHSCCIFGPRSCFSVLPGHYSLAPSLQVLSSHISPLHWVRRAGKRFKF